MSGLLALDISSTNIGWVLWDQGAVEAHGCCKLDAKGATLYQRMSRARIAMKQLIINHQPRALAIEGPAYHAKPLALIAQQRVAGVVLLEAIDADLPTTEVPPTVAKKVLAGKGNAKKYAMQQAAKAYFDDAYGEHEADALAVALAAQSGHQPDEPETPIQKRGA